MSKAGVTEWYGEDLVALVENATQQALTAVALQIEGLAKRNVVGNNQVDTGFMLNSVYAFSPDTDHYGQAKSAAQSKKDRTDVFHDKAQVTDEGGPWSAVAVGAKYGVYQERAKPFLEPAMAEGISQLEAQMITEHKKAGL